MSNFTYFDGEYTEKMPKGYIGRSIYRLEGRGWTIDGRGSFKTAREAMNKCEYDDEQWETKQLGGEYI